MPDVTREQMKEWERARRDCLWEQSEALRNQRNALLAEIRRIDNVFGLTPIAGSTKQYVMRPFTLPGER